MRRCQQINDKSCRHAQSGGCKSVVPTELFAERAANERREKRAKIDADVKYRKCAVAASVGRRIKPADLCRDIRLEGSVAEDEESEREQEERLKSHRKMSGCHQCGSD